MKNPFENIISFLLSPPQIKSLQILKMIFIIWGSLFLIGTLIFLFKTRWLRLLFLQDLYEVLTYKHYAALGLKQKWKRILRKTRSSVEAKIAIIEAEKILNGVLIKLGYKGKNLEENLKELSSEIIPSYEELLKAHQVYLSVIEDPSFTLSLERAKEIISIYERVLKELGVM